MVSPVFYSVCPFGTGTIETGNGNISISGGVATLTVAQTGNIGAGVCIEYNSIECWIAPNRIAFNSGGTTELLYDTKIVGTTSGATGIVRFVEVTGGTWAGGTAAGWIYFESTTGTWNSSETINRTKPTSSTNIATTNGSLQGNIGNGNTQFVVKTAIGGIPTNVSTPVSVTSIHHEYASLSDFESGFIDANHINNADLTSADIVAHACCYYDHDDQTVDWAATTINFGTTDATRYLAVYTPMGDAESINKQRHTGEWDANKYIIKCTNHVNIIISEEYVTIEGLQVSNIYATGSPGIGIDIGGISGTTDIKLSNNLVKGLTTYTQNYHEGIRVYNNSGSGTVTLYNNIIYDFLGASNNYGYGIALVNSGYTINAFYNTVSNTNFGIYQSGGTLLCKNTAIFNTTDDFYGTITCDYCVSDDANATTYTNGVDWTAEATDWDNVFTDYANGDFSLNNFAGSGTVIEQGTDLSASEGIWRDITGNERGSTPDIGAFEYIDIGGGVMIPVFLYHYNRMRKN